MQTSPRPVSVIHSPWQSREFAWNHWPPGLLLPYHRCFCCCSTHTRYTVLIRFLGVIITAVSWYSIANGLFSARSRKLPSGYRKCSDRSLLLFWLSSGERWSERRSREKIERDCLRGGKEVRTGKNTDYAWERTKEWKRAKKKKKITNKGCGSSMLRKGAAERR